MNIENDLGLLTVMLTCLYMRHQKSLTDHEWAVKTLNALNTHIKQRGFTIQPIQSDSNSQE